MLLEQISATLMKHVVNYMYQVKTNQNESEIALNYSIETFKIIVC